MPQLDYQIGEGLTAVLSVADVQKILEQAVEPQHRDASIVVRIVDAEESRALNQQYRHKDAPTNVLSFPFEMPAGIALDEAPHLGDLVLCAPVIAAEAQQQHKSAAAHWTHMIVHGVLHLQGYDHHNDTTATTMENRERRILANLGYPDPYASDLNND